jgi:hypothetical protein
VTDINKTFRNILKRWGHDVLIQRRLDDDFNYSSKFERVTTRHMYPANSELSNLLREASEGVMADALEMIYYFDKTINPRVGDRIYENMQDHPDGDVVYLIDSVIPMRGRRGLIDYWVAGATKEK